MSLDVSLYRLTELLFARAEKICDESIVGSALDEEVKRAQHLKGVSQEIINASALQLKANLTVSNSISEVQMPKMLEAPKRASNSPS